MKEYTLIDADDASSSLNSVKLDLGDLGRVSLHAEFTGSDLVGTLALDASNNNTDWVQVTDSDQAITAAASHMWNLSNANYRYLRVSWAYTSGTGNLSCTATVKENISKRN